MAVAFSSHIVTVGGNKGLFPGILLKGRLPSPCRCEVGSMRVSLFRPALFHSGSRGDPEFESISTAEVRRCRSKNTAVHSKDKRKNPPSLTAEDSAFDVILNWTKEEKKILFQLNIGNTLKCPASPDHHIIAMGRERQLQYIVTSIKEAAVNHHYSTIPP